MFNIQRLKRLVPGALKQRALRLLTTVLRFKKYGFNYRGNTNGITFLCDGSNPAFFGYHDKTPFSADGSKILAMSIEADDRKPESECTPMKLGYFKKSEAGSFENQFVHFADTTTWCFQQGCMLQWHPLYANTRVVFNRLVGGKYGSVVFDLEKNETIREYNFPIYSLDPLGRYAATLNFSRLGRLRPGYGYGLLADQTEGVASPDNDGLLLLDLQTGKAKLLVSLATLASDKGKTEDEHYVNHATFSPDGSKIIFFNLCLSKDKKRNVRLCLYDITKSEWYILEKERSVSHYAWKNDIEALVTTKELSGRRTRRISVYNAVNCSRKDILQLPGSDTHPMRSPKNEHTFILDSYPDSIRDQHLYLFDINNKEPKLISSLYSPPLYTGQVRCDLHPRWDREGKCIVVDTARNGRRQMAVINI